MKAVIFVLGAAWAAGVIPGGPAAALPRRSAAASMEVVDSMSIGAYLPLLIERLATNLGSSVQTVLGVSGLPNQAYSIRLPESAASLGAVAFENMSAWSDTARGNVGNGYLARTDDKGRDRLRFSGNMRLVNPARDGSTASMTLGIDYQ